MFAFQLETYKWTKTTQISHFDQDRFEKAQVKKGFLSIPFICRLEQSRDESVNVASYLGP